MRCYDDIGVQVAKILLPRKNIDFTKWAVIACDQYTSQPEYWKKVEEFVGSAPSTLHLIYPEIYLEKSDKEERVKLIQEKMREYLEQGVFSEHESIIYVERTLQNGKKRKGIMLCLDLEQYDYSKGSTSLIRATEGTILERLPPRIKIRENALLELPHILVLIDDPFRTVIEPLEASKQGMQKLYDFELMMNSGRLAGFAVDYGSEARVIAALKKLANKETFRKKYGLKSDKPVLLFAVGDGNHSLATAKAIWEKKKEEMKGVRGLREEELRKIPSRYALVEIVNLHDESLEFEPIHRVLFNLKTDFLEELQKFFHANFRYERCSDFEELKRVVKTSNQSSHKIGLIKDSEIGVIEIQSPRHSLAVGTIQEFLDSFMARRLAEKIDYVHGDEVVRELGLQKGNLGLYLPSMGKEELFKAVILNGVVPRKTFSMGEADDKRFYMECRRIK